MPPRVWYYTLVSLTKTFFLRPGSVRSFRALYARDPSLSCITVAWDIPPWIVPEATRFSLLFATQSLLKIHCRPWWRQPRGRWIQHRRKSIGPQVSLKSFFTNFFPGQVSSWDGRTGRIRSTITVNVAWNRWSHPYNHVYGMYLLYFKACCLTSASHLLY